jgi:hypothetical protein
MSSILTTPRFTCSPFSESDWRCENRGIGRKGPTCDGKIQEASITGQWKQTLTLSYTGKWG